MDFMKVTLKSFLAIICLYLILFTRRVCGEESGTQDTIEMTSESSDIELVKLASSSPEIPNESSRAYDDEKGVNPSNDESAHILMRQLNKEIRDLNNHIQNIVKKDDKVEKPSTTTLRPTSKDESEEDFCPGCVGIWFYAVITLASIIVIGLIIYLSLYTRKSSLPSVFSVAHQIPFFKKPTVPKKTTDRHNIKCAKITIEDDGEIAEQKDSYLVQTLRYVMPNRWSTMHLREDAESQPLLHKKYSEKPSKSWKPFPKNNNEVDPLILKSLCNTGVEPIDKMLSSKKWNESFFKSHYMPVISDKPCSSIPEYSPEYRKNVDINRIEQNTGRPMGTLSEISFESFD